MWTGNSQSAAIMWVPQQLRWSNEINARNLGDEEDWEQMEIWDGERRSSIFFCSRKRTTWTWHLAFLICTNRICHLYQSYFQRVNLADHDGQDGAKNEGDEEGHHDGGDVQLGGEGGVKTAFVQRFLWHQLIVKEGIDEGETPDEDDGSEVWRQFDDRDVWLVWRRWRVCDIRPTGFAVVFHQFPPESSSDHGTVIFRSAAARFSSFCLSTKFLLSHFLCLFNVFISIPQQILLWVVKANMSHCRRPKHSWRSRFLSKQHFLSNQDWFEGISSSTNVKTFPFLQRLNLKGRKSDDALVGVGRAKPQCRACFGAFQAFRSWDCLASRFCKQQSSVDLRWDWTPWRGTEQPLLLKVMGKSLLQSMLAPDTLYTSIYLYLL